MTLFLSMLVVVSQQCKADDWKLTLFIPSKNGAKPQTINSETGVAMVVRQGVFGSPPKDCPLSAFWALTDNTLVDCNNGEQFQLIETDASKQKGAFVLIPKPVPQPYPGSNKTDKPGPMNKDPKSSGDSKVIQ